MLKIKPQGLTSCSLMKDGLVPESALTVPWMYAMFHIWLSSALLKLLPQQIVESAEVAKKREAGEKKGGGVTHG